MATETNPFNGYTKATADEIALATQRLKDQADPLADILSFTEKINLGWKNTTKIQGELESQLQKTHSEMLTAQLRVQETTGQAQKDAKNIVASIAQRRSELEKELGMLRVINSSGLAPMFYLAQEIWKVFNEMDASITKFNISSGLMRSNTQNIQFAAQQIAINLMQVGVTIDGVLKSWTALSHVYGSVYTVSQELVKTTSLLAAQLGVSEENSAGFFKNMAAVSGTTMLSQQHMASYAGLLSAAAGTNLNQVMGDLASKSANTLNMMSRIPAIAIKAAIEFRRLGTSLDEVANSSRHILNFTESVQEEMNASVLLGRSLNLDLARRLAYQGDLVGSNKEILRLAQQNQFLTKMDVFQREAFAAATGKSVAELTSMVQAETEWNKMKMYGSDKLKAQISDYERLKDINEKSLGTEEDKFALSLQQKSNQERMVAIQQKWNQLVAQIMPPLLKITDWALSIVPPLLSLLPWVTTFGIGLFKIVSYALVLERYVSITRTSLGGIGGILVGIANKFRSIQIYLQAFRELSWIQRLGGWISPFISFFSSFGKFGAFLSPFLRILGPIGIAITAFQVFNGIIEGWKTGGLWGAIGGGIKAALGPIYTYLIAPFFKFLGWFQGSDLPGHSPSKLGLSIVKGIISVGAMLYDALTYPFRHAFAWILDHIPGMGKVASGLRDGFGGVATTINHKLDNNEIKPSDKSTVTAEVSKNVKEQVVATKEQKDTSGDTNALLQGVIDAIAGLRKDLNDGKIAINLDGSRVSTYLARSDAYKGSFSSH